jgi:threonine synthase
MFGFQAEGAAPIVRGQKVDKPETIATAIRIGNPASWDQAVAARDDSGGLIDMCSDAEILLAYRLLASKEGVFVEPSSAIGVAGLLKLQSVGKLDKGQTIVITVTGNGLKDPQWALESAKDPISVAVDSKAAAKALGLAG